MQVRYQAALRPDKPALYRSFGVLGRDSEDFCNLQEFAAQGFGRERRSWGLLVRFSKAVPGAADGEALVVEQLANTPHEQYFVVLVVTTVTPSLYRFELSELLFPVAQDVRLYSAQFADFANREITFGGDRRQYFLAAVFRIVVFHRRTVRLRPSASGWHGK